MPLCIYFKDCCEVCKNTKISFSSHSTIGSGHFCFKHCLNMSSPKTKKQNIFITIFNLFTKAENWITFSGICCIYTMQSQIIEQEQSTQSDNFLPQKWLLRWLLRWHLLILLQSRAETHTSLSLFVTFSVGRYYMINEQRQNVYKSVVCLWNSVFDACP